MLIGAKFCCCICLARVAAKLSGSSIPTNICHTSVSHVDDVGQEIGVEGSDAMVVEDAETHRFHGRLKGLLGGDGCGRGVFPDDPYLLDRLGVFVASSI